MTPRYLIRVIRWVACCLLIFLLLMNYLRNKVRKQLFDTYEVVLLNGISTKVLSTVRKNGRPSGDVTMVFSHQGRSTVHILKLLSEWDKHCGTIFSRIVISWNPPHSNISRLTNFMSGLQCPSDIIFHPENRMTNRLALGSLFIDTQFLFQIDNDIFCPAEIVTRAYKMFRTSFSDSLFGFFGGSYKRLSSSGQYIYQGLGPHQKGPGHFVLVGMTFFRPLLHDALFSKQFEIQRKWVDEVMNADDMVLNFVSASVSSLPAVRFLAAACCNNAKDIDHHYGHSTRELPPIWNQEKRSRLVTRLLQWFPEGTRLAADVCMEQPTIHVIIPFGKISPQELDAAVASVHRQRYVFRKIWLAPDGKSPELDKYLKTACKSLNCIDKSPIRLGGAQTKHFAFHHVFQKAKKGDIVLVLDGDDELLGTNSLGSVADMYVKKSCWCTYGSMSGLYEDQGKDFKKVLKGKKEQFHPREMQWMWVHPRSFRVELIPHMKERDFRDKDGQWVMKATDAGFIFRMLELAGYQHSCFVDKKIYSYKTRSIPLSSKEVSPSKKREIMNHFKALERSLPLVTLD